MKRRRINLTRYKYSKRFVFLHHQMKTFNRDLYKKTINLEND